MSKNNVILFAAVMFLTAVAASSCNGKKEEQLTIRMGYLQNDLHHLPLFVALDKGFFNEAGLNIEITGIFKAGPEEMSAFGAGDLDIGYVGQAPATAAVLNNIADVTFLSQVNRNGSALVVKRSSPYRKLGDLAGTVVAIPGHATMQDFLLRHALENHGLAGDAVTIIVLKPPEMLQALEQGSIAAFIAWEPYPAQAVQRGVGRILIDSEDIWDGHPCCVLVAGSDFTAAHRDTIEKIIAVHKKSCDYIAANSDEVIGIGVKYTGLDKKTVAAALQGIDYSTLLEKKTSGRFVEYLRDFRYLQTDPRRSGSEIPFFDNGTLKVRVSQ